jgi:hypothetical protein
MGVAHDIRGQVERAGGRLETTVREIRDAFGVSRLTAARRRDIHEQLRRVDLRIEPPLETCALDDRVAVVDLARRAAAPAPPVRAADPPRLAAGAGGRRNGAPSWVRRRGVIAAAVGVLVVVLLAAVLGSGSDTTPGTPDVAAGVRATGGTPAPDSRRDAVALLTEARASIADDDVAAARRELARIDQAVLAEDADLRARVTRTRALARSAERYIAAEGLAAAGSYAAAHERMLAVAPFRDARARAGVFATRGARDLVARARGVYVRQPGRALGLLTRAEDLDPSLPGIEDLRERAIDRQAELAAPPPPPPPPVPEPAPPAPAASSCDPAYTGACIPVVGYDLDCGDVSATDFRSVGSDPHGFDREGDGYACES